MVFAVAPQVVRAQEPTQNREARAHAFIDLLAGGQYAQAVELFTPEMKAAMPVAQVNAPMLVLQGERDYQVTMEEFSRWKSALADRADVVFHSYPALNHLFVAGTRKSLPAEYNTPGHVSEAVVRDIATWITALRPRSQ